MPRWSPPGWRRCWRRGSPRRKRLTVRHSPILRARGHGAAQPSCGRRACRSLPKHRIARSATPALGRGLTSGCRARIWPFLAGEQVRECSVPPIPTPHMRQHEDASRRVARTSAACHRTRQVMQQRGACAHDMAAAPPFRRRPRAGGRQRPAGARMQMGFEPGRSPRGWWRPGRGAARRGRAGCGTANADRCAASAFPREGVAPRLGLGDGGLGHMRHRQPDRVRSQMARASRIGAISGSETVVMMATRLRWNSTSPSVSSRFSASRPRSCRRRTAAPPRPAGSARPWCWKRPAGRLLTGWRRIDHCDRTRRAPDPVIEAEALP